MLALHGDDRESQGVFGVRVARDQHASRRGRRTSAASTRFPRAPARREWKFEQRAALLSLVTTGGGLLFGGDVAGRFRAFDQRSGKVLWQTNLGSQVTGFPITYAVGDRQYIAVSVGQAVNTAGYLLITPEIRPSNNNSLYRVRAAGGMADRGSRRRRRKSRRHQRTLRLPQRAATPRQHPRKCRRTDRRVAPSSTTTPNRLFSAAQSAQGKKIYTGAAVLAVSRREHARIGRRARARRLRLPRRLARPIARRAVRLHEEHHAAGPCRHAER